MLASVAASSHRFVVRLISLEEVCSVRTVSQYLINARMLNIV